MPASVQDPHGKTGLAHMFEHMAFKGTSKIGTTNYPAGEVALPKVEKVYAAYIEERDKPVDGTTRRSSAEEGMARRGEKTRSSNVVEGAFDDILERNGAQG